MLFKRKKEDDKVVNENNTIKDNELNSDNKNQTLSSKQLKQNILKKIFNFSKSIINRFLNYFSISNEKQVINEKNKLEKTQEELTKLSEEKKKLEDNIKKQNEEKSLVGFLGYLKNNWKMKEDTETAEQKKGIFKRFINIYDSYKEVRIKETDNLQIYDKIEKASYISKEYLVLLFSSCLIATFGLYQNSVAVIIGAMLVAPLMMPILAFSLGSIWGDKKMIWKSFLTLIISSILVLILTSSITYFMPGIEFNDQIEARIKPNLFDIVVAIVSGIVGAYAYVNPRIGSSIAGVAIAVALMPPLCTIGICLGKMKFDAAYGALLLYLTNLIGISLAASFVFWRMKVHPALDEKKSIRKRAISKIILSSFLLLIIALPLFYFMQKSYLLKVEEDEIQYIIKKDLSDAKLLSLDIKELPDKKDIEIIVILPIKHKEIKSKEIKNKIKNIFPDNEQELLNIKLFFLNSID